MDNANSPEYLEKIKNQVIENLRATRAAPSVQMTDVPRGPVYSKSNPDDPDNEGNTEDFDERETRLDDQDQDNAQDTRYTERRWDKHVQRDDELYDSDDEEQKARHGVREQPDAEKRRVGIMDNMKPDALENVTDAQGSSDQMALDENATVAATTEVDQAAAGVKPETTTTNDVAMAEAASESKTVVESAKSDDPLPLAQNGDVEMAESANVAAASNANAAS